LKFVVRFAGADSSAFREGYWLNLKEDLYAFLREGVPAGEGALERPGLELAAISRRTISGASKDALREIQHELSGLVRACAARGAFLTPPFTTHVTRQLVTSGNGLVSGTVGGELRDVVLDRAYHLLIARQIRQLDWCPVEGCGRVFFRVRRQRYCSPACFLKAYMAAGATRARKRATDRKAAKAARMRKARARPWK